MKERAPGLKIFKTTITTERAATTYGAMRRHILGCSPCDGCFSNEHPPMRVDMVALLYLSSIGGSRFGICNPQRICQVAATPPDKHAELPYQHAKRCTIAMSLACEPADCASATTSNMYDSPNSSNGAPPHALTPSSFEWHGRSPHPGCCN
jgi:hypothetical protein